MFISENNFSYSSLMSVYFFIDFIALTIAVVLWVTFQTFPKAP